MGGTPSKGTSKDGRLAANQKKQAGNSASKSGGSMGRDMPKSMGKKGGGGKGKGC